MSPVFVDVLMFLSVIKKADDFKINIHLKCVFFRWKKMFLNKVRHKSVNSLTDSCFFCVSVNQNQTSHLKTDDNNRCTL